MTPREGILVEMVPLLVAISGNEAVVSEDVVYAMPYFPAGSPKRENFPPWATFTTATYLRFLLINATGLNSAEVVVAPILIAPLRM